MFDLEGAVRTWRDGFAQKRTFSTRDLDELEDHLRAAYDVELHLDPGLTPARAFAYACESLGAPTELSGEFTKVEGKAWRRILRTGWLVYGTAFLLPVAKYGITVGQFDYHEGLLPGFQAFQLAIRGMGGAVGVVSALTNMLMLVTFRHIADAPRHRVWLLALLMITAMVLNLWWLVSMDEVSDLLPGYYAWVASFGVVGAGLTLRAKALPESSEAEELVVQR